MGSIYECTSYGMVINFLLSSAAGVEFAQIGQWGLEFGFSAATQHENSTIQQVAEAKLAGL